jgi:hypothetical protein
MLTTTHVCIDAVQYASTFPAMAAVRQHGTHTHTPSPCCIDVLNAVIIQPIQLWCCRGRCGRNALSLRRSPHAFSVAYIPPALPLSVHATPVALPARHLSRPQSLSKLAVLPIFACLQIGAGALYASVSGTGFTVLYLNVRSKYTRA